MYGDETITLHYEEDLDDLATVRVDRIGAPVGGQVHVTVSDFRLNLDPTGDDVWTMWTNGTLASYKRCCRHLANDPVADDLLTIHETTVFRRQRRRV